MFLDVHWCTDVGLSKRLVFLAVRRCLLGFSFYCCPTAAMEGAYGNWAPGVNVEDIAEVAQTLGN
jgi:hypothetical protein